MKKCKKGSAMFKAASKIAAIGARKDPLKKLGSKKNKKLQKVFSKV